MIDNKDQKIELFTIRDTAEKQFENGSAHSSDDPKTAGGLDETLKYRASKYSVGETLKTDDKTDEPGYYLVEEVKRENFSTAGVQNLFSQNASQTISYFHPTYPSSVTESVKKAVNHLENKSATKSLYMFDNFTWVISDYISENKYTILSGFFEIRDTLETVNLGSSNNHKKDLEDLSSNFGIFFHLVKKTEGTRTQTYPPTFDAAKDFEDIIEFYDYAFIDVDYASGEKFLHLRSKSDIWHYNGTIDTDYCEEFEVESNLNKHPDCYDISNACASANSNYKWSKMFFPKKWSFKKSTYRWQENNFRPNNTEQYSSYILEVRHANDNGINHAPASIDSVRKFKVDDSRDCLKNCHGIYKTLYGTYAFGHGQIFEAPRKTCTFLGPHQSMMVKINLSLDKLLPLTRFYKSDGETITYANFGRDVSFYVINNDSTTAKEGGSYDVTGSCKEHKTEKDVSVDVIQVTRNIYQVIIHVPTIDNFSNKVDATIDCRLGMSTVRTPEVMLHKDLVSSSEVSKTSVAIPSKESADITFNAENRVVSSEVLKKLNISYKSNSHTNTKQTITIQPKDKTKDNLLVPPFITTEYTYTMNVMNTISGYTKNNQVITKLASILTIQYRKVGSGEALSEIKDKSFTLDEATEIEVEFTFSTPDICIDEINTSCSFMTLGAPGFGFDGPNDKKQLAFFNLPSYSTSINIYVKLRRNRITVWNTSVDEGFAKNADLGTYITSDNCKTSPIYLAEDVLNVRASSDLYEYFPGDKIKIIYDLAANLRLLDESCIYVKNSNKTYAINDYNAFEGAKDNKKPNGRSVSKGISREEYSFFVDSTYALNLTMYGSDMDIYLYPTYIEGCTALVCNENQTITFKPIIKNYYFEIFQMGCRTGNGGNGGAGGTSLGGATENEGNYNGLAFFPFRSASGGAAVAAYRQPLEGDGLTRGASISGAVLGGFSSMSWDQKDSAPDYAANTSGSPGGNGGNGYIGGNGGRASDPIPFHITFQTVAASNPEWYSWGISKPIIQNLVAKLGGWPDFFTMQIVGGAGGCGGQGGLGYLQSGRAGSGTSASLGWYSNGRDGFSPLSFTAIARGDQSDEHATYCSIFRTSLVDDCESVADKNKDSYRGTFSKAITEDMHSYIGSYLDYLVCVDSSILMSVGSSGFDGVDGSTGDFRRPGGDGSGGGGGGPAIVTFDGSGSTEVADIYTSGKTLEYKGAKAIICMGGFPGGALTTSLGGHGTDDLSNMGKGEKFVASKMNNKIYKFGYLASKGTVDLDTLYKLYSAWMDDMKTGGGEVTPVQAKAAQDWVKKNKNISVKNNIKFSIASYIALITNITHAGKTFATTRTRYDKVLTRYISFYKAYCTLDGKELIKCYKDTSTLCKLPLGYYIPGCSFYDSSTLSVRLSSTGAFNKGFGRNEVLISGTSTTSIEVTNSKTAIGGEGGQMPTNTETVTDDMIIIRPDTFPTTVQPSKVGLINGKKFGSVGQIIVVPVTFDRFSIKSKTKKAGIDIPLSSHKSNSYTTKYLNSSCSYDSTGLHGNPDLDYDEEQIDLTGPTPKSYNDETLKTWTSKSSSYTSGSLGVGVGAGPSSAGSVVLSNITDLGLKITFTWSTGYSGEEKSANVATVKTTLGIPDMSKKVTGTNVTAGDIGVEGMVVSNPNTSTVMCTKTGAKPDKSQGNLTITFDISDGIDTVYYKANLGYEDQTIYKYQYVREFSQSGGSSETATYYTKRTYSSGYTPYSGGMKVSLQAYTNSQCTIADGENAFNIVFVHCPAKVFPSGSSSEVYDGSIIAYAAGADCGKKGQL